MLYEEILGYGDFLEGYTFNTYELLAKCQDVIQNPSSINLPDVPVTDTGLDGVGPRMISFGIDDEYVMRSLNNIIDLCLWAISNNYEKLSAF